MNFTHLDSTKLMRGGLAAGVKSAAGWAWLRAGILLGFSAAAVCTYLLASRSFSGIGFPLDDAWIHQTYARNLAVNGEWAFLPGQPSAGSTAPLWSLLLAVGHILKAGPFLWTFALGTAVLFGLASTGVLLFASLCPDCRRYALLAGLFLTLEWHMVWASASGMETLLQAVLILLVFWLLLSEHPAWFWIGVLVGVSVWVRPDGITLLGPALMVLLIGMGGRSERVKGGFYLLLGFLLLFLPYLLFNHLLAGSWWPNTFFAKQAEYAAELNSSIFNRLWELAALPLVGAGVLALPGFIYYLVVVIRRREWAKLAGAIWFCGYLGLYAMRLPVSYQHGRYLMPAMPVYFLWGLAGVVLALANLPERPLWRIISRVWLISIAAVWLVFFLIGAGAYRRDVAVIQTEMVATARWVAENIPPEGLVAAHDIGALGYFGEHALVDMAGLVSPEVIPFIRDQARLAAYLDEKGVEYLVTFPSWYPMLVGDLQPVYQSHGTIAPEIGGENMVVYHWR